MPKGVYPRKPHSLEWRRKHSEALMGHTTSLETREKQRIGNLGKKRSLTTRLKNSQNAKLRTGSKNPFYGRKHSAESLKRLSLAHIGRTNYAKPPLIKGNKHWNWKGGVTKAYQAIRTCQPYKLWQRDCFERDNYTCIWCGDNKGGNLNVDHIKPFALILKQNDIKTLEQAYDCEELWDISNGRTLCVPCHKTTITYGNQSRRTQ